MKIMLCQISDRVINSSSSAERTTTSEMMYAEQWRSTKHVGYWKPNDFWELPLWIGEVSYALRGGHEHDVVLHIVTPGNEDLPLPNADVYCFSALDANKELIHRLLRRNASRGQFYIGGYVDPKFFDDIPFFLTDATGLRLPHPPPTVKAPITWCNSVKQLCEFLGVKYKYGVDWHLFSGAKCIPRLTMSYGCKHGCTFCTVPKEVKELDYKDIEQQVRAMRVLQFKLVYLNDKTWGMASNHLYLRRVYKLIKQFNPEFEGFIVQTSVAMVTSFLNRSYLGVSNFPGSHEDMVQFMWDCGVRVVELGVETYNNYLLDRYRKPQREEQINRVVTLLSARGFKVIANIILGLPGETLDTYRHTYEWLTANFYKLFGVNIYTFAVYHDAQLSKELDYDPAKDCDERCDDRTFWTLLEREAIKQVSDWFYVLGLRIWAKCQTTAF